MSSSLLRASRLWQGLDPAAQERLKKAWLYATSHLSMLRRRSGETYAVHGAEVALTLRELTEDAALLAAAILHDLPAHPHGRSLLRLAPLSSSEQTLVRQMHRLRRLHIDVYTGDLDTVLAAFTKDPRLLPLRMAHRLTDVRHLNRFRKNLRREIAQETLHMYTAIAGRLGMNKWRAEMEDACFLIVQPHIAENLLKTVEAHAPADELCLAHSRRFLVKQLRAFGLEAEVSTRIKTLYSMYRKMIIKKRRFDELTDRLALRIVVQNKEECYRALGIVHSVFHPIPGKLKDYIGAPKENGYRSIHTVVYPLPGVSELPIEIQIRTQEMQKECEFGLSQHGQYKNYVYALDATAARVNLLRNLASLREEAPTPQSFEQALRTYFSEDRMAVFDARNRLYHIRRPATALDFIFHAHGGRARFLRGIRINGRERPLSTPLKDGDTVEPRFARTPCINAAWLDACTKKTVKTFVRDILQGKAVTIAASTDLARPKTR